MEEGKEGGQEGCAVGWEAGVDGFGSGGFGGGSDGEEEEEEDESLVPTSLAVALQTVKAGA